VGGTVRGAAVVGAAVVGGGVGGAVVVWGGVAEATAIVMDGSGENELDGETLGGGALSAAGPPGRATRISSPNAMTAITALKRNAALWTLDPIPLGLPPETELAGRRHVPEQR
jgi:hypothetical protein